jgi:hypothetical protein
MVIGTGIVLAEPSVDEGMVRRLVVDPQKEELPGLEVELELEDGNFEGSSVGRERLRFNCDRSGERAHLALTILCRVFIDERCCC